MIDWTIWKVNKKNSKVYNSCPSILNDLDKFELLIDSFDLPLQLSENKREKDSMRLKFPSSTLFDVCKSSDYFLDEADLIRYRFWHMMKVRYDCTFFITTKRAERIQYCLPDDWGEGWKNVVFIISAKDEEDLIKHYTSIRELPLKHIFILFPLVTKEIDLSNSELETKPELNFRSNVECIISNGDNYTNSITDFEWHKKLSYYAKEKGLAYVFNSTGNYFRLNDKVYKIPREKQISQASKSGIDVSKVVSKDSLLGEPFIKDGIEWRIENNVFVPVNVESGDIEYNLFFNSNDILRECIKTY